MSGATMCLGQEVTGTIWAWDILCLGRYGYELGASKVPEGRGACWDNTQIGDTPIFEITACVLARPDIIRSRTTAWGPPPHLPLRSELPGRSAGAGSAVLCCAVL